MSDHDIKEDIPSPMKNSSASPAPLRESSRQQDNSRSSVFENLPPDLRRAVNVAIIERCPSNFRAIWMQFELGKFGVSYYAFYRYARRLRDRVNLVEAAGLSAEDDPGLDDAIEKLASRRLFELLLNTDGVELNKEIAALFAAHSRGVKTKLHDRQLADRSRLFWARLEHDREHLRLKSELLHTTRDGVMKLLDEAKQRRSTLAPAIPVAVESRASGSEPRPSGSAEWSSQNDNRTPSREPRTDESSIPHSDFRIPTSSHPANPQLDDPQTRRASALDDQSPDPAASPANEALHEAAGPAATTAPA